MVARPLPRITPMAPTLIAQPFHREGWVYEEKYDGWRLLAYKDADRVRLMSRNGRDLTQRFPELVATVGALPARTLILDGEIAVFDTQLNLPLRVAARPPERTRRRPRCSTWSSIACTRGGRISGTGR
jgi:ATP-dependent DNA ligase